MSFPVLAAGQHHDARTRLFLRVDHDGVAGFGEVAPQPHELNGDAALLDVIDELRVFVVPQLQQILEREGDVPSWTRIARFAGPRAASNPAVALVEMAILDRELPRSSPRHFLRRCHCSMTLRGLSGPTRRAFGPRPRPPRPERSPWSAWANCPCRYCSISTVVRAMTPK